MNDINEQTIQEAFLNASRTIASNSQQNGWHCFSVEREVQCPQYSYSIGLENRGEQYELSVVGLMPHVAHGVMHSLVERAQRKTELELNVPMPGIIEGYDVLLAAIDDDIARSYFKSAFERNASPSFLQIVWPDAIGRFPNDSRMNPAMRKLQTLRSPQHCWTTGTFSPVQLIH